MYFIVLTVGCILGTICGLEAPRSTELLHNFPDLETCRVGLSTVRDELVYLVSQYRTVLPLDWNNVFIGAECIKTI